MVQLCDFCELLNMGMGPKYKPFTPIVRTLQIAEVSATYFNVFKLFCPATSVPTMDTRGPSQTSPIPLMTSDQHRDL